MMVVYWLIWFFIYLFSILDNRGLFFKFVYVFFILFLTLFVGLRYEVGVDWDAYLIFYETIKKLNLKDSILFTEPAYGLINYISGIINFKDTFLVNLICAIIIFISFFVFSRRINNRWVPLLVSYTYFIVVVSMNYTRQSVAVSLSLLALYFALNKKIFQFILFLFLATLFHKSAIILIIFIPLLFFNYIKFNGIIKFFYIVSSLVFITSVLFYSSLSSDNIYLKSSGEISSSGAIFRVCLHAFPIFLYCYYRGLFRSYFKEVLVIFDYSVFLIFYCLILAVFYSTLADRFNLYFLFFDIVVFSFLVNLFNLSKKLTLITLIFVYYSFNFYIWFNFGTYADDGWIPYQNYFFKLLNDVF